MEERESSPFGATGRHIYYLLERFRFPNFRAALKALPEM
jgi:hypothetical protein